MTSKIHKLYNVLVIGGVIAAGACKRDPITAPLAAPIAKQAPAPAPEPVPAALPEVNPAKAIAEFFADQKPEVATAKRGVSSW